MQTIQRRLDLSDATKMRRVDAQVWDVAEAVFTELAALNQARGSKLVLVYLPAPPDLTAGAYDLRRGKLAAFCAKSGIPCVDLTPEIRTVSADSLDWMFITENALKVNGSSGHYTPMGHAWVAERLAAHLRELHIVAPR